ncbi:YggT family protein [Corynebacterium sp. HMSC074A01]|uniref:YggT family protein n=1 Tax=Corynebacterium sp. HMSC074A01 TaxID=1715030 RepID=UPI0008A41C4F|nr:YggT family protein [Corynebacterium sp. HMSC074A01]OHF36246.1 hypothetical protein HMPREF2550_09135 [Corynebacterium sp. HMSC074A01]
MALLGAILYALVGLYSLVLIIRLIIEMIESFSRRFTPPHWFMVAGEFCFRLTDPPVKAVRRLIPPLRAGNGIGIDVSVIVLFIALMIIQMIIARTMLS